MRRPSGLDRMVENFQHNWETDPRFRALWSGGLGLGIVVVMCACLGFAFTFAGAAAASLATSGSGAAYAVSPNGTVAAGSADSNLTFPTQTVPGWGAQQVPAGAPIPPSDTPAPTPTAAPTATPVPTSAVGPGNGNGGGNGGGSSGTVSVTSSSFKSGAPGSVSIHTSVPNATVNIFVRWPNGTSSPTNGGTTNGSGDGTITTTAAPNGCSGTVNLWIVTDVSGSTNYAASC